MQKLPISCRREQSPPIFPLRAVKHVGDPHCVVDGLTFSQASFAPNTNKEFDVARDGRRFLLLLPPKEKLSAPTRMILNWPAMVKKN